MMTTEQLAWRMLEIAHRHRDDDEPSGFNADMCELDAEPNFAAALARMIQIVDERFPSVEVH